MVFETHHVFETQLFTELGCDLHGLVIDRVAPVETDQGRGPVIAGEELRADQSPQSSIGIIVNIAQRAARTLPARGKEEQAWVIH